jgi:UDP-N-acetyl-D-galactosamine dehydrogenase
MNSEYKIAIIGLGYVGLPLAVAFAEKYKVVGFDINLQRIGELKKFNDRTLEISNEQLKEVIISDENYVSDNYSNGLYTTMNQSDLADCNFFIVTVPTPTDKYNRPVLIPLIKASETVGKVLKLGDIVVYESTVYPGVTEDECMPVLEKVSG